LSVLFFALDDRSDFVCRSEIKKVEAIKKKSKPLFANDIKERIKDAVNAAIEDAIEEFVDDGMVEEDIASVVMDAMEEAIEDLKMEVVESVRLVKKARTLLFCRMFCNEIFGKEDEGYERKRRSIHTLTHTNIH
jgi:hypothetical protein